MKFMKTLLAAACIMTLAACEVRTPSASDANVADAQKANDQQQQYSASQPVPFYDWSLEREMVRQLYDIRNLEATTHSVWRSDLGTVEGDCSSIGFGIPYDTSLTNPLVAQWGSRASQGAFAGVSVEQPEPNGIFASKNTAATWVMCAGTGGKIEPVYVETRVTTYPYPVKVDYATNRVTKAGKASVTIGSGR